MKGNRKLLAHGRRFLAMLLAVTMVTGTLPSSLVYAAELPAADTEDVANALPGDVTGGDITADDVTTGDVKADGVAAEDVTDGDVTTGDAKTVDVADAEPVDGGAEASKEVYAAEVQKTVYTFDRSAFDEKYKSVLPYGDNGIRNWHRNVPSYVHVLADGKDWGSINDVYYNRSVQTELKWQFEDKEKGGWVDYTDNSYPDSNSKVGNYKLILTIPAKEGVNDEAKYEMAFEITKREVEPQVTINPVRPGTLAQSVKADEAYIERINDTYIDYVEDPAQSGFTLKYAVKDAYTGATVDGALLQTGDYVIEITPAFTESADQADKDSYTLKAVSMKLEMDGLITPEMNVTMSDQWKDKENEGAFLDYSVIYTGNPIVAPAAPTDYTLKVQYADGVDAESGDPKYADISFDAAKDLTYEWYEADGYEKLDGAPVNAGTYYYRITYNGKAGLYGSAYTDIEVVVTPKKLTLVPQWKDEKAPTFYPGMTARDVLAAVTYVARDEAGAEVAVDREHIWGDYRRMNRTIPFEPVFKLQVVTGKDADNKPIYEDVDADSALIYENEKTYRVIFSGEKAVYYGDGSVGLLRDINYDDGYGADQNYEVITEQVVDGADGSKQTLTGDALYQANALPVVVSQGKVATIDVSKIPALAGTTQKADAGTTYDNPFVKVYDGARLYGGRADYKLAEVKGADGNVLASGTDQKISYIWCYQYDVDYVYNEETQKYEEKPYWTTVGSGNSIPSSADDFGNFENAGNYMLVVSYSDPTHENHAESKAVYYRIEKQKIKVVPKTAPSVLTETAVDDYDFSQIEYEIRTVVAGGEGEVLTWIEGDDEDRKDYTIDWKIEQKTESDADFSTAYGNFTKGTSYRIAVRSLNMRSSLKQNYMDYEVIQEGTGDTATFKTKFLNETLAVNLSDMGTTELKIEVDGSKLIDKVYDGTEYPYKDAVTVTKAADGSEVKDVELTYLWEYNSYEEDVDGEPEYVDGKYFGLKPVNGGTYTFYVSYGGSTTYKAVEEPAVGSFKITPKELQAEIVLGDDPKIVAGTYWDDYDFPLSFNDKDGKPTYAECDADAFTWQGEDDYDEGYYPAIYPDYIVKDEKGEEYNQWSTFKGEKTYTVYVTGWLADAYGRNYTINSKGVSFKTVRGNSTVEAVSSGDVSSGNIISEVALTDTIDGMTHTIKPEQGIDYINNFELDGYKNSDGSNKKVSGNYLAFKIELPAEYRDSSQVWKDVFYQNSIENVEKAGGYILEDYKQSWWINYITVAFDASKKDTKEFQIRWEQGYIETFKVDFSGAILGADLTKAVEPKSIAFNSPNKKMVVGGTQALDVKLAKKLQNDIICLQYTVENPVPAADSEGPVLCVDEDGYVVALNRGKADVIVTPVYENEEGELKPIPGAKTAKVTINVTDVTAPKIQKVAALDTCATVTYGQVSDGYRREVYVIKEKNVKKDEFESRIASMTNGNWEGLFAVAPAYYDSDEWTVGEWRNKQASYTINGLQPQSEYTVYVRNVSRARTLDDGCKVTISGNGNVKAIKTTKPQVRALSTVFDYGEENDPVQYYFDDEEDYDYDYGSNEEYGHYEVRLSTGSTKVGAIGLFREVYVNDAADPGDGLVIELPIRDSAQKKIYEAPKLVYQVAQRDTYWKQGYYDYDDETGYYYNPTSYASIDKSGKLKLNGVYTVYVRVYDSKTLTVSDWARVKILATPDSIVGKSTTFEVGQTMSLTSLVDYKEGNLVLKGVFDKHIVYDKALRDAVEASDYFEMSGTTRITAVKPGGSLELTLADLYCGADKTTKVTLKTKPLAAVSGLKASFVVDDYARMSFNYNGRANKFKVEVTDGRGRIVESKLYDKSSFVDLTNNYQLGYDLSDWHLEGGRELYYYTDAKGKNYYFFPVDGLTKLSSYSVTVTAIWQNGDSTISETSKTAKKAVKTTKMPASYGYLEKEGLNYSRGGVGIFYRGAGGYFNYVYDGNHSFSSGNTYELVVQGSCDENTANRLYDSFGLNGYAKNMISDTLTWTSSNKKVATVKANAGTYTATLKAIKTGYTVIEVKSKITKKVIGRYGVYVDAVGTARWNYFGENEKQTFSIASMTNQIYADMNNAAAAVAEYSFATAIEGTGEGNTYNFTAPADGTYSFWTTGDSNVCGTLWDSEGNILAYSDGGAAGKNFKLSYKLAAGEQVSIDVREWTFGDFAATLNISAE